MGIFDVFKTKVNEATEKAGDVAGQAKEKVSDMMDKKKGDAANNPSAQTPAQPPTPVQPPTPAQPSAGAEPGIQGEASDMVSEGAPVAQAGEAAPGAGDEAPTQGAPGGGMTQSIKDNVAKGADKGGEMAEDRTGNRYDDKIDSGVQQAKDKLG